MAELVEMNMERSMIEFEQMKTLKLFDDNEIKEIIRKREHFEYTLAKQHKELKDYLLYIQFERNLMKVVQGLQHERNAKLKLELSIAKKIKKLYQLAVTRYAHRERLWDEYIVFCMRTAQSDDGELRELFTQMRHFHADKPAVWLKAIRWERHVAATAVGVVETNGRTLLLQAIRQHPQCTVLCVELLSMLLSGTDNATATGEDADALIAEQELRLQRALTAYQRCGDTNRTLAFQLDMLSEATRHPFAGRLRAAILEQMRERHGAEPLYWHSIAQRELNGESIVPEAIDGGEQTVVALSARDKLKRCVQVYESAVTELASKEMWAYYLDAMLALDCNRGGSMLALRRRVLGRALKRADVENGMSAVHYVRYVQILKDLQADSELVEEVLQRALQRFADSVPVWTSYMETSIQSGNAANVLSVFEKARRQLAGDAQPLWTLYATFLLNDPLANAKSIRWLYEQATVQITPAFAGLKVDYLDYVYRHPEANGGMERVHAAFRLVVKSGHLCIEMVQKLAELEQQQPQPNIAEWRYALRIATELYGRERIDVWLELMKFEKQHGNASLVSRISQQAEGKLDSHLLDAFVTERTLWQSRILEG